MEVQENYEDDERRGEIVDEWGVPIRKTVYVEARGLGVIAFCLLVIMTCMIFFTFRFYQITEPIVQRYEIAGDFIEKLSNDLDWGK